VTAKAALCDYLLKGKVLNIKNCFSLIGLTNCPREISRMIEQPFGVQVSRVNKTGKSRFGQYVTWIDYRLNKTEYNAAGIEKMKAYLSEQKDMPTENKTVVKEHVRHLDKKPSLNLNRLF
jgi:hypothetical protein